MKGPSGKTELGRRLGSLLSLVIVAIDMTQVKVESDLFGPGRSYAGNEYGSKLNNFLAENSGRRAIVMLDEIERCGPGVLNSLLVIIDEGTDTVKEVGLKNTILTADRQISRSSLGNYRRLQENDMGPYHKRSR
jgi:ATP-dependent Clp protease ATP-binding subunit ClpA